MRLRLLSVLIVLLTSCGKLAEKVWSIKIKNNAAKDIWYYMSYNLPDTSLPTTRPVDLSKVRSMQEVLKDQQKKWEEIIDTIPAKKLAIFIFEDDILRNYDWNEIQKKYLVAKRFDLSVSELQQLGWKVEFK